MPEVDPALNGRFTHRHNVRSFLFGFAKDVATGLPVASLRERIAVVTQKPVLLTLLVTLLWATGAYNLSRCLSGE
jgi:hypothetical protein